MVQSNHNPTGRTIINGRRDPTCRRQRFYSRGSLGLLIVSKLPDPCLGSDLSSLTVIMEAIVQDDTKQARLDQRTLATLLVRTSATRC